MGHVLRDLEIQAQHNQLSNFQPTRVATTDAFPEVRQHPASSELRSVFAAYICTCGTCVLSEWTAHASKSSTHVELSVGNFGLFATVVLCDVAQCNI